MIRTDVELVCEKAAKRALAQAIGECGFDRPPSQWSPGEAQAIARAVIDAYRKEFWKLTQTEIPF